MKIFAVLSVGPLVGFVFAPEFDSADVNVPIARTESSILSSSNEICLVRFLGDESLDENADYAKLVRIALSPQNPQQQPAAPASALPSTGGQPMCSSGTGGGNANCSTSGAQTTCSVNGNGHNCSAADVGGNGQCSATSGSSSNQCSVHAGNDTHCSSMELPNNPGNAQCSAFDAGFCSVFGGGGAPGAGGGGSAGGQDNSCSAFGSAGQTPKCSAFATNRLPLCSVLKDKANATCTVVDSENYGPGAGTCSTMNGSGTPVGPPPVLCSVIDLSTNPPTVTPPGANGRCTTSKPPPPPPRTPVPGSRSGSVSAPR